MSEQRPKEFWIYKSDDFPAFQFSTKKENREGYELINHVIDYSSYEELLKERDELKAELDHNIALTRQHCRQYAEREGEILVEHTKFRTAGKALVEAHKKIAKFEPWDVTRYPGCGSSDYSYSGYKSFISEQALAQHAKAFE